MIRNCNWRETLNRKLIRGSILVNFFPMIRLILRPASQLVQRFISRMVNPLNQQVCWMEDFHNYLQASLTSQKLTKKMWSHGSRGKAYESQRYSNRQTVALLQLVAHLRK